jgi:serine protease Do
LTSTDLAILKSDAFVYLPTPSFGFNSQTVDVGTSVYTMGFPLLSVLGEELKITDGIISSKTGYQGDISTYQISAPIQPGNSGGALFDKRGNLVGITNAGIPGAQNIGFAIKASYLHNLLELLPEKVETRLVNRVENFAFTTQIKELGKFIVIVKSQITLVIF